MDTITVVVTESTAYRLTIDPADPHWSWLLEHPRGDWKRVLTQDAATTGGAVDLELEVGTGMDGCWREVEIIGSRHDG